MRSRHVILLSIVLVAPELWARYTPVPFNHVTTQRASGHYISTLGSSILVFLFSSYFG